MPRQQRVRNVHGFKGTLMPLGISDDHDDHMRVRRYSRDTRGMAGKM